ncbi:hypothetical protein KX816_02450 [Sphingosinicellaceae bacterium]|nr:hypothetical protein KX816_02450 [Sphingosinicellaceae bacterium]
MRKHILSLAAIVIALLWCNSVLARCFEPLANPTERDPKNFRDLLEIPQPPLAPGVNRFEPVTDGLGPANIDFYFVRFKKPAGVTLEDFFKQVRQQFPAFSKAKAGRYGFGPYETSLAKEDAVRKANADLWASSNPMGALMVFNLGSVWPVSALFRSGKTGMGIYPVEKAGGVQVICSSPTDFVFATVDLKIGDEHPVAGRRAFGIMEDSGGQSWTFYSKAVDQNSGSALNALMIPYGGIFCAGHTFWISFYGEFRAYLADRGLTVEKWSLKNHGYAPYPFQDGTQPEAKVCNAPELDGSP